jgi:Taurine catabolism dioxygenase TauD, TfdA family
MPELLPENSLLGRLNVEVGKEALSIVRTYGFAVVRSIPAELNAEAINQRSEELLAFSQSLGTPIVQSPRNELVEDVKDYSDVESTDDRGYRSGGELLPHSDPPSLIVLHCLQAAKQGGESSLVRVAAIVDRMMERDPSLVEELFQPLPDWRVAGQNGIAEGGPGDPRPVLAKHNGKLSCVLYRPFLDKGAAATGTALTPHQIAALDLFEQYSLHPELSTKFLLQPGESLVLHNRTVLHARTNYVDWPEMHRRRHFLRVWIDAPDTLPVHPSHELGDFFAPR